MRIFSIFGVSLVGFVGWLLLCETAEAQYQPARLPGILLVSDRTVPVTGTFRRASEERGELEALERAAAAGRPAAQWRLARIYARGDGVARDDLKAFSYFRQLADGLADVAPVGPRAHIAAAAFVALARYHYYGIENSKIRPNPPQAAKLLTHAATYFGDSQAQYELGLIYLEAGGHQIRRGARYLLLAARKGHAEAQCVLGRLLFAGREGLLPPQPMHGLMWLEIGRQNASADAPCDGYEAAFAMAESKIAVGARRRASHWLKQIPKDRSRLSLTQPPAQAIAPPNAYK